MCAFVASDGRGGTVPSGNEGASAMVASGYGMGGTVPAEDEGGTVVPGSGSGAAGSDMCLPFAHREGQPGRGITSLMRTDDHVDRAMFMSSSGNPG